MYVDKLEHIPDNSSGGGLKLDVRSHQVRTHQILTIRGIGVVWWGTNQDYTALTDLEPPLADYNFPRSSARERYGSTGRGLPALILRVQRRVTNRRCV